MNLTLPLAGADINARKMLPLVDPELTLDQILD